MMVMVLITLKSSKVDFEVESRHQLCRIYSHRVNHTTR